ncbi:aminotransferase class I/II-fold pyridoxal phosphate-dependent enzyme [Streptomyces sirii]|uniref:aminotransferase class I/II-fold pyridoxal phosphate-dependent enzyme n=1 Tax=Streptomyces sirii TaxID=3127701 RepID=UPI003D36BFD9
MTAVTVAPPSPNLALNQLVDRRRAEGASLVHLAFGEARLPVLPQLAEQLALGAARASYGPVAGAECVRDAVAGYFTRRRLPTEADRVIVAPGSKPLLMALQLVIPGDVLLPRPAWNTYAPQARYAGKKVYGVPIPAECGGVPAPGALRETIRRARAAGADPRLLVLTLPDNPTGTLAPPALIRELCALARAEDLLIISDEIYRDIVHDPESTPSSAPPRPPPSAPSSPADCPRRSGSADGGSAWRASRWARPARCCATR